MGRLRRNFHQQLDPLSSGRHLDICKSGNVATRSCQAFYDAGRHWVRRVDEDDRNYGGREVELAKSLKCR